jgi:tape measure domain-containing protein
VSQSIAGMVVTLGLDTSDFQKEMKAVQSSIKKALGPEGMAVSKDAAVAFGALTLAVEGFGLACLKVADDMQREINAFTFLTGGVIEARLAVEELESIQAATPFEFPGIFAAAKKMENLGFSTDDTTKAIKTLSNTAAAIGFGDAGIQNLITMLGKVKDQGVVTAREMRSFAMEGIPAWELLAESIGVSVPKAMQMVKNKAIDADTFIKAILDGLDEKFKGAAEKQASTMTGAYHIIKTEFEQVMEAIGYSLNNSMDFSVIRGKFDSFLRELKLQIETVGVAQAFRDMLPEWVVVAICAGIAAIAGAAVAGAIAINAALLSVGVALAPISLAFAAFGALVGVVIHEWDVVGPYFKNLWEGVKLVFAEGWYAIDAAWKGTLSFVLSLFGQILDILSTSAQWVGLSGVSDKLASLSKSTAAWKDSLDAAAGIDFKNMISSLNAYQSAIYKNMNPSGFNVSVGPLQGPPSPPSPPNSQPDLSGGGALEKLSKMHAAIQAEWVREEQGQKAFLMQEYQNKLQELNKEAGTSETYFEDAYKLRQIYAGKITDVTKASEEKKLADIRHFEDETAAYRQAIGEAEIKAKTEQHQLEQKIHQDEQKILQDHLEQMKAFRNEKATNQHDLATGKYAEDTIALAKLNEDWQMLNGVIESGDLAHLGHIETARAAMEAYIENVKVRSASLYDNLSILSLQVSQNVGNAFTSAFSGVLMGTMKLSDAVKNLGKALIQTVLDFVGKWIWAETIGKLLSVAATAFAATEAAALGAIWAGPAALASLASFGGNAGPAMAGIGSTVTFARMAAIPKMAEGGIITRPTLSLIGEGRHHEAVIPLDRDRLERLGLGGRSVSITQNTYGGIHTEADYDRLLAKQAQSVEWALMGAI